MQSLENKETFITVTSGMSGYFAVHVRWNPEGFWEPYDTGYGRYATKDMAIAEAKAWAASDGMLYKD